MSQEEMDHKIKTLEAAKTALQMEINSFVDYARREIDPTMSPSEALTLAAMVLHNIPELFAANPAFLQNAREAAVDIRLELTLSN